MQTAKALSNDALRAFAVFCLKGSMVPLFFEKLKI